MPKSPSANHTQELLVIGAVVLLLLVPFSGKAFHIDDTLFLKTAAHLQENPWNFYGFSTNWEGYAQEMWDINQNPPLVSYFIATASLLAGWGETALHAAFLLPALAFGAGVYLLAGLFCPVPLFAALLAVLSPVFAISATTVMSDLLMCAFYVWALYLWIRGIEEERGALLAASAVCIALGFLTKYFAATALPLLLVYTIGRERRVSRRLGYLLVPILIIAGYEWLTSALYGHGLLARAFLYPSTYREFSWAQVPDKTLTGLCFTGGCVASPLFLLPFARQKKIVWPLAVATLFAVLLLLLTRGASGGLILRDANAIAWGKLVQMSLWITLGVYLLALSGIDLRRSPGIPSLFLCLWVLGTFAFSVYINWTVNGRTLLPLLPAVAIQQARCLPWLKEYHGKGRAGARIAIPVATFGFIFIPAALLAFAVAWADASLANAQRTAAQGILRELPRTGGKLWFQGHWGFQFYMEQDGALPLDFKAPRIQPGDFLVIPINNTNLEPAASSCRQIKQYAFPALPWLTTMGLPPVGAGFYADVWGPLPFSFGNVPPEEFYLFACGTTP